MQRYSLLALGCLLVASPCFAYEPLRKEDMPRLLKDLSAAEPKVRIAACEGIGEVGEIRAAYAREAVEPLLDLVKNDVETKVREAAAIALGRIDGDPEKVVPVLIEVIKNDKERTVVASAILGLCPYGKAAREAMPVLKEMQPGIQKEANELRDELQKAQREMDTERVKAIQVKGNPVRQLTQALQMAMQSIQVPAK